MSSSSSDSDDSQDKVAAMFKKSDMKRKQEQQQQHHKRRLSSTSSSSPPPNFMPPPTIGGETKSASSPTTAVPASYKITASNAADHNTSKSDDDDDSDDEDDVPLSSRATKRSKNTLNNRLAGMAQKQAIRERQLKVKLQENRNSDDDDSDDDENGGAFSSKNLTKSIDKGRIAIIVETKIYDEDGNCCSMGNTTNNNNQENTFTNGRTTRSTAAAAAVAAAAGASQQQAKVYELDDSSDDEKPVGGRGGRRPIAAIDPATIVAAVQGTGVDATALLQARQAMMKLQSQVLDCNDDDDEEDDDDDLQCSSLPFDTSLNNNAPPPRLLQLNVLTTLEDLDGVVEEPPKTVTISMLSNETFKGLKENLLEQLSLPKTASVTLRFQEHALYLTQTPDTLNLQLVGGAMNGGEPAANNNHVMESGSMLHARIFGVSSKKAAATKKGTAAASSSAAATASTAANFGPSLTLTLRSKDGQLETFKLRQKEPFQVLADAYRAKKTTTSCRVVFQFDGQNLQMTQTPLQCDMENDDLIDVQVNE